MGYYNAMTRLSNLSGEKDPPPPFPTLFSSHSVKQVLLGVDVDVGVGVGVGGAVDRQIFFCSCSPRYSSFPLRITIMGRRRSSERC